MSAVVRVKLGVEFAILTPGGIHILAALDHAAAQIAHDLTITSGTDGEHSGPDDPHHRGEAFDIRSYDLPDKTLALNTIMGFLGNIRFYCFLEDPDTKNEHIHC